MLRKLSTSGFRGLGEFTMDGLGRVNLLVGSNNCGKTTVLDAVHMLLRAGDPFVLWSALARRGEDIQVAPVSHHDREMDVGHLFEGHEIDLGSSFVVSGENHKEKLTLEAKIVQAPLRDSRQLPRVAEEPSEPAPVRPVGLALQLRWSKFGSLVLPLSQYGGFHHDTVDWQIRTKVKRGDIRPVELITTRALSEEDTVASLEDVVLTENEDMLIRALRSIEPGIERIAPLGSRLRHREGGRGGIAVKLAGMKHRIPLGSMGDGMWRMLGIALSVVRAKGGVLLIDEIDTGLHYTVMEEMWRLVYDAAKRFDVQVFAATHSRDCYQSLAAIVQAEKGPRPEVSIQRIERGNPRAVAFTDDEITVAAEIGAEVR